MSRRSMFPVFVLVAFASLNLVACGNEKADVKESSGEVAISLTDASGDFLSYEVEITAIRLVKANGAVVNTLPVTTQVDFTEITELSELITAATVPSGTYVKATVIVDYANAVIEVDDGTGAAVKVDPADIKDSGGAQATQEELDVKLNNLPALTIAPGVPAHLALDFDLAASNQVDMSNPAKPVVTVQPVLAADLNPATPKPHRVRGPLASVDQAAGSFVLDLKPFAHQRNIAVQAAAKAANAMGNMNANMPAAVKNHLGTLATSAAGKSFGTVTVLTDANTVFEISGVKYSGATGSNSAADGLKELADPKYLNTGVIALGNLNLGATPKTYTATEVYAGTSVPGGSLDLIRGIVTKRETSGSDTILTVKGFSANRSAMAHTRGATVLLKVSDGTNSAKVVKQALKPATAPGIDDISIGQQIEAAGTLAQSGANQTLDATVTGGIVRMLLTSMSGIAPANAYTAGTSSNPGTLVLDIAFIEGRPVKFYDFNFTGTLGVLANGTLPNTKIIDDYDVDTDAMSITAPAAGDPVRIIGFVKPFLPATTTHDFEAQTVVTNLPVTKAGQAVQNAINHLKQTAHLAVDWWKPFPLPAQLGVSNPFSQSSSSSLVLDTSKAKVATVVVHQKPTTLSQGTTIVPATTGVRRYVIHHAKATTVHTDFGQFVTDLTGRLGSNTKLVGLTGMGSFDASNNTFTANSLAALLR